MSVMPLHNVCSYPKNEKTLSVILPVHRATDTFLPLIEECLVVLPRFFTDYEIIVVNDHGDEGTVSVIRNLVANYETIMMVNHLQAQGYGRALVTGFAAARGDIVLVLDANDEIDVQKIDLLLAYLDRYAVIIGYRLQPLLTWHQHLVYPMFSKLLHLPIEDIGYHFSIIRTDVLRGIKWKTTGTFLLLEIAIRARKNNIPYIFVGLPTIAQQRYRHRIRYAQPKLSSYWDMVRLWIMERPIL